MAIAESSALIISDHDYQRLLPLTEKYKTATAELLEDELGRAEVVSYANFPANVVAMNSCVTFLDMSSGEKSTVSLVYPQEANIDEMKISILSPIGSALIGLRVGGRIDWPLPAGAIKHLQVVAVVQAERL